METVTKSKAGRPSGMVPWENVPFSDVCVKIQDGSHFSPKEQFSEPGPGRHMYITSKNIRNGYMDLDDLVYVTKDYFDTIYPRCKPELNDVLLTKDGANTGNVTLNTVDEPYALLSSVCLLKPDRKRLLPQYLMYYIQSPDGFRQLTGKMTGTAIKRIILERIREAPIPLAPLPQQRRIVEAIELQLGRLDAAVARLQWAKARLKRYKQAVLKAAVEGSYCETPLEEWTENVLGDIATTIRNGYSKKPNAEEGIRIFRISAVRPLELFVDDVRYLDGGTKDHEASMVTPGDVLFTRYNGSRDMVGACALVPDDCPPTVHPDKLIRVRVPTDELLPGMLAILGTVGEGRAYIESKIRTTAGQSGISGGDLKSLPLRYPAVEAQKRIIHEVDVRLDGMQELEATLDAQLQQAVRLRQAVLKRAFEGKLV